MNQAVHRGAQAVLIIDNYLLAQQKSDKYNQWLDRYTKHPREHEDAFLFGMVVQAMFSGGMKGEIVDRWMPRMMKAFNGWDVTKIANLSEQDFENLIRSDQVIKNKDKLRAVIKNAKMVLSMKTKYGSLGEYLASFQDTIALAADLQQFKYLKEVTIQDFLRNIGYDAAKPDRHITRWLTRMDIVGDSIEVNQILKTVYAISEVAKIPRARFDSAIYLFCADRKDVLESGGICGNTPNCQVCPIQKICSKKLLQHDAAPSKQVKPKPINMATKSTSLSTPKADPFSVWNTVYQGKSVEYIRDLNPFATPSWLNEPIGQLGSRSRIEGIQRLFSVDKFVSRDRIIELGTNNGRYVAFRAIVHGYADWDGKGLMRTNKSYSEF